MSSDTVRKTITFPKKLADKIEELADHEHRSFSAQIIMMIKQGIVKDSRFLQDGIKRARRLLKDD